MSQGNYTKVKPAGTGYAVDKDDRQSELPFSDYGAHGGKYLEPFDRANPPRQERPEPFNTVAPLDSGIPAAPQSDFLKSQLHPALWSSSVHEAQEAAGFYDREDVIMRDISDPVTSPSHYTYGKIETWEAIEDWDLGYHLGCVVKYVSRAGKKDSTKTLEDLLKARSYLDRKIKLLGG